MVNWEWASVLLHPLGASVPRANQFTAIASDFLNSRPGSTSKPIPACLLDQNRFTKMAVRMFRASSSLPHGPLRATFFLGSST